MNITSVVRRFTSPRMSTDMMPFTDFNHAALLAAADGVVAFIVSKIRGKNATRAALLQAAASLLTEMAWVGPYIDWVSEGIYAKVFKDSYIDLSQKKDDKGVVTNSSGYVALSAAYSALRSASSVDALSADNAKIINSYLIQRRIVHAISTGIAMAVMQEIASMLKVKAITAEGEAKAPKGMMKKVTRVAFNFALSAAQAYAGSLGYDTVSPPLPRIKAMDTFTPLIW